MIAAALFAAFHLTSAAAFGAEAIPAPPTHFVTDDAGFLSPAARAELDQRLQSFEGSSGHQVLLWIGRTTGAVPIEDWAVRAFAAWRVGRRGLDDGVVLFILTEDRKARIEVGYGLEDRLPDARAAAIIRDQITPRLRDGDRDGAARAGVGAIVGALGAPGLSGKAPFDHPRTPGAERIPDLSPRQIIVLGIVLGILALFALGFLITHPRLAILLLTNMASSRGVRRGSGAWRGFGGFSSGGGGFSGGGFSGGGGRSGGGGATGSW